MRPDGMVFGYFETPDSFDAALAGMATEPINDKWQDFMAPFFQGVGGIHPDRMMEALEQVFFLE
jgi:L-rhamnose mutarotase